MQVKIVMCQKAKLIGCVGQCVNFGDFFPCGRLFIESSCCKKHLESIVRLFNQQSHWEATILDKACFVWPGNKKEILLVFDPPSLNRRRKCDS